MSRIFSRGGKDKLSLEGPFARAFRPPCRLPAHRLRGTGARRPSNRRRRNDALKRRARRRPCAAEEITSKLKRQRSPPPRGATCTTLGIRARRPALISCHAANANANAAAAAADAQWGRRRRKMAKIEFFRSHYLIVYTYINREVQNASAETGFDMAQIDLVTAVAA